MNYRPSYPECLRFKVFLGAIYKLHDELDDEPTWLEMHDMKMARLELLREFQAYTHRREAIRAETEARKEAQETARRTVCDGWKLRKHSSLVYHKKHHGKGR